MFDTAYDVVVLGGGVAGCASARELAADHDVIVLDKGSIAGEGSGLAAGLIAPTLFHADRPAVARHANRFFREFDGIGEFRFTRRPQIELVTPEKESTAVHEADRLEEFPVSFLERSVVERRYPAFDLDGFAGVVEYRDTGWLDPYTYTVELKNAAEARGADVESGVTAHGLIVEDGQVIGVKTDQGDLRASTVVTTLGWRTRSFLDEHLELPLLPFRLQCLSLESESALGESFPIGRYRDAEFYFRPEHNGTFLVGGGEYVAARRSRS